jgi:hypothetical protein
MRAISSLLCLAALIGVSSVALAQDPHAVFFSFDIPGATDTQATARTSSGYIVGRYHKPDGSLHGFLLRKGRFSSIDVPGADATEANWINDSGVIVGDYNDGHANHGFQLSEGRFSIIDDPGSPNTEATGIGSDSDIVGVGSDGATNFRGFLLKDGTFSSMVFPGTSITFQEPTMIANGRIVGGYVDAAGTHGYLLADGDFRTIDCPTAPGNVFLSAIDSLGRMAGEVTTTDGHQHGLVVSNGECLAVDFPGSVSSGGTPVLAATPTDLLSSATCQATRSLELL